MQLLSLLTKIHPKNTTDKFRHTHIFNDWNRNSDEEKSVCTPTEVLHFLSYK